MKKPLFFCMELLVISLVPIIFIGVMRTPVSPRPLFQMGVTDQTVLLTFNVLWGTEEELNAVLTYLKSQELEAIFFVTGEWIKNFPGAAANILEHGQQLGNHSVSHRRLILLVEEDIAEEVKGFNRICMEMLDYTPAFFSPSVWGIQRPDLAFGWGSGMYHPVMEHQCAIFIQTRTCLYFKPPGRASPSWGHYPFSSFAWGWQYATAFGRFPKLERIYNCFSTAITEVR